MPDGFNYGTADQSNRRPVADWRARGVTAVDGSPLPDHGAAAIIAPAGARGPAFAVYQNFFVIKRYNNATSYAMGVGHLGDRIAGRRAVPGRLAARRARALAHREDRAAAAADRARLHTGATDGVIGPNTIAAIRAFQAQRA